MQSKCFFFFNDTATTEIYTLSLHDALPISGTRQNVAAHVPQAQRVVLGHVLSRLRAGQRSEEHTSELQSRLHLVCSLLLEQQKKHHDERTPLPTKLRTITKK